MSTTGSLGGKVRELAAATWTSLATEITLKGNNVNILTFLTDVRLVLVAPGVTPTGTGTGIAVGEREAMNVIIDANSNKVLWAFSTAGGKIYTAKGGTTGVYRGGGMADVIGTVGPAGMTVEHFSGDGKNYVTKITVDGVMPTIAGGASLGVGLLAYTFPAGVHLLKTARISLLLQQTTGKVTADQPEISLGSVIVVGAVATMTTGTWEDVLTAAVMNDCDGTVEELAALNPVAAQLVNAAGGVAKTVFINIADGWAADGDPALGVVGEVWLEWTKFSD